MKMIKASKQQTASPSCSNQQVLQLCMEAHQFYQVAESKAESAAFRDSFGQRERVMRSLLSELDDNLPTGQTDCMKEKLQADPEQIKAWFQSWTEEQQPLGYQTLIKMVEAESDALEVLKTYTRCIEDRQTRYLLASRLADFQMMHDKTRELIIQHH